MSGPPFQGLQKHTEVVKDTLQGLLETYAQVPGLIHEASSKEVISAAQATASREASHSRTQESLDLLPGDLAAFDQVLDDVLARAHDIQHSLLTLRTFNSKPTGLRQPAVQQYNQQLAQQQQPPKQHQQ